jgi:hypothetical protein
MSYEQQVLSKLAVPPAFQGTDALADELTAWVTALLAAGVELRLFNNNLVITPATLLSDLVEAEAPGYAGIAVTALHGPYFDVGGNAYVISDQNLFTTTGGGSDIIYGAYLIKGTGAAATVTFTETGGAYTLPVVTSGGAGYTYTPKVIPTGATGSGAKLHAVVTGGVVTSVVIDAPGTGYTTATAVIQPPAKLLYVANFGTPLPLIAITDAIPVVVELDELLQVA